MSKEIEASIKEAQAELTRILKRKNELYSYTQEYRLLEDQEGNTIQKIRMLRGVSGCCGAKKTNTHLDSYDYCSSCNGIC